MSSPRGLGLCLCERASERACVFVRESVSQSGFCPFSIAIFCISSSSTSHDLSLSTLFRDDAWCVHRMLTRKHTYYRLPLFIHHSVCSNFFTSRSDLMQQSATTAVISARCVRFAHVGVCAGVKPMHDKMICIH